MPRVSKAQKRMAHEGLEAQSSFKVQLRRLAHHLAQHRITVQFKRKEGDKYARMVILRPEHKPVAFSTGHPSERNLELLQSIAHCAVESGGAGMTWDQIRLACNTPNKAADAPPPVAVVAPVSTGGRKGSKPAKAQPGAAPAAAAPQAPKGEGSVARAWAIASAMPPKATRKEIVAAMVAQGINPNTAQAQYVRWNKANRGGAKF